MRTGPGWERWGRLLLVVLLVLPLPAALDLYDAAAENDENRLRVAAGDPNPRA